jgi:signal transduction histidine kinase
VYRVAQLHGGEVAVESTPGSGTRFAIDLREVPA